MTRQITVSEEAFAALCEAAGLVKQATGSVVEFSKVIESLLGARSAA